MHMHNRGYCSNQDVNFHSCLSKYNVNKNQSADVVLVKLHCEQVMFCHLLIDRKCPFLNCWVVKKSQISIVDSEKHFL